MSNEKEQWPFRGPSPFQGLRCKVKVKDGRIESVFLPEEHDAGWVSTRTKARCRKCKGHVLLRRFNGNLDDVHLECETAGCDASVHITAEEEEETP